MCALVMMCVIGRSGVGKIQMRPSVGQRHGSIKSHPIDRSDQQGSEAMDGIDAVDCLG